VDASLYPFAEHAFESADGTMHYVDEGSGPVVVLVHGTPVWSFVYRAQITTLVARGFRVIAPDHLGFGRSEKAEGARYHPQDHARRLEALLQSLHLRDLTLVVHDFGGPIGLHFALNNVDRIAGLVIMNTWGWPLTDDARIARTSRLLSGAFGRWLYTRLNASPRWLIPAGFADRAKLSPHVHAHYLAPFLTPSSRLPLWQLARDLIDSSAWYAQLHERLSELKHLPILLLWGMQDTAFGISYCKRWRVTFPEAKLASLETASHFLQDECPEIVSSAIGDFAADISRA
jgi:haloalkane dehalogenase